MAGPIRVTILSDSRLMREAMASRLARESGIESVRALARFEDLPSADAAIAHEVFLIDAARGSFSAAAAISRIRRAGASRVVVVGAAKDEAETLPYIEAGAVAFLDCDAPFDSLLHTVHMCVAGHASCSLPVLRQVLERLRQIAQSEREQPMGRLTARETETAELVAQGLLNKQIAKRLGVKTSTVKTHLRRMAKKLHATRRRDVARLAFNCRATEEGDVSSAL